MSREAVMIARIYKPTRNAMQSGTARTKLWVLEYEPSEPREVEPLMGWTSSTDMRAQLRLRFDTKEAAVAYCEANRIPYEIHDAKKPTQRQMAYADNFAWSRRGAWTH